jgi:hypothetical protein
MTPPSTRNGAPWTDRLSAVSVIPVERDRFSSGTSWHSAGDII